MKKWVLPFLFSPLMVFSQTVIHDNAHAHNDYEQKRPLFDALENGFTSIEADVHLRDNRLLVSHNRPHSISKTLESLYLEPLDSLRKKNGGSIYPHYNSPVFLMIDIKTEGGETFKALLKVLSAYEACLSAPGKDGAVKILISGNRPLDMILDDPNHFTAVDGRPEDLGNGYPPSIMPVISENYKKIIKWNGVGSPSQEELNALKAVAAKVHAENKKLRLWNIPDQENAWIILLDSGVDLINTDRLKELSLFLIRKKI
jgi:hypothetical protein